MTAIDDVLHLQDVHSHFQPIVDLGTGAVVGYEALSRGPQGSLHGPDALFAAARVAGRLRELDELCRRVALRTALEVGVTSPLTLFVNVEPEVLETAALDELVEVAAAADGDLQVVLEITERALAARPADLMATAQRVRSAGLRIALDDVGAHDLSLAFLPLLRPDVVKLDLTLVQQRPSPDIAAIMNAVNAYAEQTGALVLAEGIENETHRATALALGACLGQGWLFGRPAPTIAATAPRSALELPAITGHRLTPSPFGSLPPGTALRQSTKPLLVEISKHLEREAARLGSTAVVVSTFQEARHLTPSTVRRYRDLAQRVGFVGAIGEGLPDEPLEGVRGGRLAHDDIVHGEWAVAVLAPHFAAALLARDLGDDGPDADRRFEFALTYDRERVAAAARSLMSHITPQVPVPAAPPGAAGAIRSP